MSYLLIGTLLLHNQSIGQVTTVDYSSSGLPTTLCNEFNVSPPYQIGGLDHIPVCGGASFDGKNVVLKTLAGITTGTNLGTAYAIKYPFKVGKFYSITITASETSASQTSNPLIEPCFFPSLPDPNNTDPIDCGAVPQTNWAGIETNRFAGIFYATKTPKAYTLTTF
jgi:hypothetical protein